MKKLLVLSPTPTHPTNAGNRARIRKWIEVCVEEGVDFHFAFFRRESGDEAAMARAWGPERCTFLDYQPPRRDHTLPQRLWRRAMRAVNRPVFLPYAIDAWRCESLCKDVRELANRIKPSCVQVEYAFFSHLFECIDRPVFKILDTHDVLARREQIFLQQGRVPEWFFTTERQEAIALNRADCVVAIQEQESSHFRGLSGKPVLTVGHMIELNAPKPPSTSKPTAIFIGSDNMANRDALGFLMGEIWPLIKASLPESILEVFGKVCNGAIPSVPSVHLAGEVADIARIYERAWLVVCPLRFGTGLKIKSIEALGQSKALVTTSSGCSGIEDGDGKAFLRSDLPVDFATHCISILKNRTVRNGLEQGAQDYAKAWNLRQRNNLLHVLTSAGFR